MGVGSSGEPTRSGLKPPARQSSKNASCRARCIRVTKRQLRDYRGSIEGQPKLGHPLRDFQGEMRDPVVRGPQDVDREIDGVDDGLVCLLKDRA